MSRLGFVLGIFLLGSAAVPVSADEPVAFVDLFDGKTLTGWNKPFDWGEAWVEDDVICLKADKKFFLVTDKKYADFVLEAEIMLPAEGKSNSGIMFRCHATQNRVFGYQAECDPSPRGWTGGLYDEGRRAWLFPKADQAKEIKLLQAPLGEWIQYRIECHGSQLKISVNGELKTEFVDEMDAEGYLALQHHGEKGQTYRFRNVRIQELKPAAAQ